MDLLIIYKDEDSRKRSKVYHNIDPASIVIMSGKLFFAHPDCWQSRMISNRYQIELDADVTIQTDPEWIKGFCETHEDCINRSLYIKEAV